MTLPHNIDQEDFTIFVVSNEPWGDQWFIKHHYANELQKLGFRVLFCDPVNAWSPLNLLSGKVRDRKIHGGLSVLEYTNPLPLRLDPEKALKLNDKSNAKKLRKYAGGRKVIVWQFDAFRFAYNFFGEESKKIYHVADHYRDLPFDALNAANSDLIVCTSRTFVEYYENFQKPVIYIPHAISDEEFDVDLSQVDAIVKRHGDYILHAGTINDRIELEIFRKICESFPDTKLVLIGPVKLHRSRKKEMFESLRAIPNFVHEGTVAAERVKNYVRGAAACILAYDFDEVQTLGPITSSLKILNYLAQEKPIVSSSRIEYEDLSGSAIYFAADMEGYLGKLRQVLNGELVPDGEKIREFLAGHTYVKFIGDILDRLNP